MGFLAQITLDEWQKYQAVNFEGLLFLTQILLPRLYQGARILNLSSWEAHNVIQEWGVDCCSNTGLHMLYQFWTEELASKQIRVGSAKQGVVDILMH